MKFARFTPPNIPARPHCAPHSAARSKCVVWHIFDDKCAGRQTLNPYFTPKKQTRSAVRSEEVPHV